MNKMKAYQYDNELVYYFETGDPAKPKMIFFHNGGTDHRVWKNQIDFFAKDFHLYAIDMPGYGRSKNARENFELHFFTEMISTFIESQKIEKCILVGNCIGAAAALLYANQFPSIVTKLIVFQIASKTLIQAGALGRLQKITGHNQFTRAISANILGKRLGIKQQKSLY